MQILIDIPIKVKITQEISQEQQPLLKLTRQWMKTL